MENISYWHHVLIKVIFSVYINSALSLFKYSKNSIKVNIINVCGEWDDQKIFFKKII